VAEGDFTLKTTPFQPDDARFRRLLAHRILDDLNISLGEAAEKMGVSKTHVHRLLHGRFRLECVSRGVLERAAAFLGFSPPGERYDRFWLEVVGRLPPDVEYGMIRDAGYWVRAFRAKEKEHDKDNQENPVG
jgi:hypothetical protein